MTWIISHIREKDLINYTSNCDRCDPLSYPYTFSKFCEASEFLYLYLNIINFYI